MPATHHNAYYWGDKMALRMIVSLLLLGLCMDVQAGNKVIYGDDARQDLYEVSDNLYLDLAKSTAGMVSKRSLLFTPNSDKVSLRSRTLSQRGICSDDKFANQQTAPSCTGFLVAPDVLVTAGHCVRTEWDCNSQSWVFGYAHTENNSGEKIEVTKNDVYNCKQIIERKLDRETQMDYAVIRLDREVVGREPLKLRTEGKVEVGDPLTVIGHPTGLPTKVADGAYVRANHSPVYFQANTDSFQGNSGSPVFNSETGVVEGILVRGEDDYVYNKEKGCREPKKCEMGACRGEDVTRITIINSLKNL